MSKETEYRRQNKPTRAATPDGPFSILSPVFFYLTLSNFNLPRDIVIGRHRSPNSRTRAGTVSMRKSSMRKRRSTSSQVTGVDTVASFVGRTEYTDASVRPHAFWL